MSLLPFPSDRALSDCVHDALMRSGLADALYVAAESSAPTLASPPPPRLTKKDERRARRRSVSLRELYETNAQGWRQRAAHGGMRRAFLYRDEPTSVEIASAMVELVATVVPLFEPWPLTVGDVANAGDTLAGDARFPMCRKAAKRINDLARVLWRGPVAWCDDARAFGEVAS